MTCFCWADKACHTQMYISVYYPTKLCGDWRWRSCQNNKLHTSLDYMQLSLKSRKPFFARVKTLLNQHCCFDHLELAFKFTLEYTSHYGQSKHQKFHVREGVNYEFRDTNVASPQSSNDTVTVTNFPTARPHMVRISLGMAFSFVLLCFFLSAVVGVAAAGCWNSSS